MDDGASLKSARSEACGGEDAFGSLFILENVNHGKTSTDNDFVAPPQQQVGDVGAVATGTPAGDLTLDEVTQVAAEARADWIASDRNDRRKGTKAFERLFQFELALPGSGPAASALAASGFSTRVFVRFDFAWEQVGTMLYRRIRQGLLSRFEI